MWDKEVNDFGKIQSGKLYIASFEFNGYIFIYPDDIKPMCGCTVATWNQDTKELLIKYVPREVPLHKIASNEHFYIDRKYVGITAHINGNKQPTFYTLAVIAQVYDDLKYII